MDQTASRTNSFIIDLIFPKILKHTHLPSRPSAPYSSTFRKHSAAQGVRPPIGSGCWSHIHVVHGGAAKNGTLAPKSRRYRVILPILGILTASFKGHPRWPSATTAKTATPYNPHHFILLNICILISQSFASNEWHPRFSISSLHQAMS